MGFTEMGTARRGGKGDQAKGKARAAKGRRSACHLAAMPGLALLRNRQKKTPTAIFFGPGAAIGAMSP
jgi:hypothetical protein